MNSTFFYARLAKDNIGRNKKIYMPFFISCMIMVAFFFNMFNLEWITKFSENLYGNTTVGTFLGLGGIVIGVLAVIFAFYANSFLMKNRKKEIALYGILGLEKRHIARMLFIENMILIISSIIAGLLIGMAFGNLLFMIMSKMIQHQVNFNFTIYIQPIIITVIFFLLLFIAVWLYNFISVQLTEPIELLKSKKQGEKQPRFLWLWALAGIICIGLGYYIAITTQSPLKAIQLFLIAVLLVIAGTHYLFASTSTVFLKLLKKNKKFYYKPTNFISASTLIYRMRKNAAGLANICILSCMVIVTVSTTATVYGGMEFVANRRFPSDYVMSWNMKQDQDILTNIKKELDNNANQVGVEIKDFYSLHQLGFMTMAEKGGSGELLYSNRFDTADAISMDSLTYITVFTKADLEKKIGEKIEGNQGLILVSEQAENKQLKSMKILGQEYQVISSIPRSKIRELLNSDLAEVVDQIILVVGSNQQLWEFPVREVPTESIYFNLKGSLEQKKEFMKFSYSFQDDENGKTQSFVRSKQEFMDEFYGFAGGLYFIGIFLGSLFLLLTVLIIYFKQISEGEEDRERFTILMKVGLSAKEAKAVIYKQLIMMFFLPLATAIIHVLVAKQIINKLLILGFGGDYGLLLPYLVITIGIFAGIYFVVYLWTSRVYYKIVGNIQ